MANQFNITGLARQPIDGLDFIQPLDITDKDAVSNFVKLSKPDVIIHCAAVSRPDECQQNEDFSTEVNVTASLHLLAEAKKVGAKFIFCSTDQVFDGVDGFYDEEAKVDPINLYGKQKSVVEEEVMGYDNSVVARLPMMFGPNTPKYSNFLSQWVDCFNKKEQITVYQNHIRSPISTITAARILLQLCDDIKGLYHIGGPEIMTRFELAYRFAMFAGVDDKLVKGAFYHPGTGIAARPLDVSILNDKIKACGVEIEDLNTQFESCLNFFNG
jgi:dTDP-4-dehydrorhamnose reductase